MNTETIVLGIAVFWSSVVMGAGVTTLVVPFLRRMRLWRRKKDRKETFYGTEAAEFNKIRKTEEQKVKKAPVSACWWSHPAADAGVHRVVYCMVDAVNVACVVCCAGKCGCISCAVR